MLKLVGRLCPLGSRMTHRLISLRYLAALNNELVSQCLQFKPYSTPISFTKYSVQTGWFPSAATEMHTSTTWHLHSIIVRVCGTLAIVCIVVAWRKNRYFQFRFSAEVYLHILHDDRRIPRKPVLPIDKNPHDAHFYPDTVLHYLYPQRGWRTVLLCVHTYARTE